MKNNNIKFLTIVALLLVIIFLLVFKNKDNAVNERVTETPVIDYSVNNKNTNHNTSNNNNEDIDELTAEDVVVDYLKKNGVLPDYYITKGEARKKGWVASEGNLCDVLPGRAIGGDVFSNREKKLPNKKSRKWYEADLNYDCGRRNADRVVFSSDGLIYVTKDHYSTFEEK